jgi:hypothetical protein
MTVAAPPLEWQLEPMHPVDPETAPVPSVVATSSTARISAKVGVTAVVVVAVVAVEAEFAPPPHPASAIKANNNAPPHFLLFTKFI